MNKSVLVSSMLAHAGIGQKAASSVDSIVAPITSIGGKLRDLSKTKAAEAGLLQERVAEMQQEIRDLFDESDRAYRIAEQLDGMVL